MRAATPSILLRNSRRLSSRVRSCSAAARSSRNSRYGRDCLSWATNAVASVLLDERVGVVAARQLDDVDVEAFADQQLRAALGGGLAGAVGVVAEHGLRREAPQHLRLLRRQRRAAGRDHRKAAGLVDLREVEVALDDQREVAPCAGRPW